MQRPADGKFAVLILAAGASKRLGTPKQLLAFQGKTLLEHAADRAFGVSPNVFVVLGDAYEACKKLLEALPVTPLYNPDFEEGMGRSIAFGTGQLHAFDHVLVMLCDQPMIPAEHYLALRETMLEHPRSIVASFYNGKPGVPAVFPREVFPQLEQLSGDKGAKPLLSSSSSRFVNIESRYAMDIDTKEDAALLTEMEASANPK
jgi:molybdenum cofactor cytidylyltransferase